MADRPMGFGPDDPSDDQPDDQPENSADPSGDLFARMLSGLADQDPQALASMLRSAGIGEVEPTQLHAMLQQMQRMLATPGDGGPVNWQLAGDAARQVVMEHTDPPVPSSVARAIADDVRLADTWLTDHTELPAAGARALAWSAAEWVEGTRAVWRQVVEPVATSVASAMTQALGRQTPSELATSLPEPLAAQAGAMMRQVGASVFGLQVGRAIGTLATEVVSGTEIGLPLVATDSVVLMPRAIEEFGSGLDVPVQEVRLYLAIREAARSRLFAHVPWLPPTLLGAVQEYARGISIDTERIESAVHDVDPTDTEALQAALANGLFEPQASPAQRVVLDRLETMLALIEGWVETVTDAAAAPLTHASRLREAVRRRRATGGPAEQTFATLVGLELRPRRLRDAAALWAVISRELGTTARDAAWTHPDLLPSAADLDDPLGYAERRTAVSAHEAGLDAAIADMLDDRAGREPTEDAHDQQTGHSNDGEPGTGSRPLPDP
ncbi:MAG: zinc-dependent metalloprotease [Angustibacter sp.]